MAVHAGDDGSMTGVAAALRAGRRDATPPGEDRARMSAVGARMPSAPGAATAQATHVPVLLDEVLAALAVRPEGVYLDGTFGGGGYSRALLAAGAGRVVGLDRDPAAVRRGAALAAATPRFVMLEGRFGDLTERLAPLGIDHVDGVVLDLGLSSIQLADATRGFSFALDGPLDMRMSASGSTAAEALERLSETELADILRRYGEERAARRIARRIVERRVHAPITRTRELAELVARALGGRGGRIDPATRTFQALRIYVNDELGELERGLAAAEALLAPGGRLAVVAFHSLEDRMVKRFLAERSGAVPRPSRHQPESPDDRPRPTFRLLTRGPIGPRPEEVTANPRARSARLRAAVRLPEPATGR